MPTKPSKRGTTPIDAERPIFRSCSSCKFFMPDTIDNPEKYDQYFARRVDRRPNDITGTCRRHAPTAQPCREDESESKRMGACWPIVIDSQWCGEFEPRYQPEQVELPKPAPVAASVQLALAPFACEGI